MGTLNVQLQRITLLLGIVLSAQAYSKYGRTCKDIGCLSSELCVMAHESCSYMQNEGKDCGSYPTCKKNSAVSNASPGANLSPAPDNTRVNAPPNSNPSYNSYPPRPPVDPNNVFGNPNPIGNHNQQNPWSNLPIFPSGGGQGGSDRDRGSHSQQPIYPAMPQHYPGQNPNPYNSFGGQNPYGQPQYPYAFGNQPYVPPQYPRQPTTTQASLLDQFLYGKSGGKKNSATNHRPSIHCVVFSSIIMTFVVLLRNRCCWFV